MINYYVPYHQLLKELYSFVENSDMSKYVLSCLLVLLGSTCVMAQFETIHSLAYSKPNFTSTPIYGFNVGDEYIFPVGKEVWTSDGTDTGTKRIQGLDFLSAFSDKVYESDSFVALAISYHEYHIFNKFKIADNWKDSSSFLSIGQTEVLGENNGYIFYLSSDDEHGEELWSFNKSTKKKHVLYDLVEHNGLYWSHTANFIEDRIFFEAYSNSNTTGDGLYISIYSDGSTSGTEVIGKSNQKTGKNFYFSAFEHDGGIAALSVRNKNVIVNFLNPKTAQFSPVDSMEGFSIPWINCGIESYSIGGGNNNLMRLAGDSISTVIDIEYCSKLFKIDNQYLAIQIRQGGKSKLIRYDTKTGKSTFLTRLVLGTIQDDRLANGALIIRDTFLMYLNGAKFHTIEGDWNKRQGNYYHTKSHQGQAYFLAPSVGGFLVAELRDDSMAKRILQSTAHNLNYGFVNGGCLLPEVNSEKVSARYVHLSDQNKSFSKQIPAIDDFKLGNPYPVSGNPISVSEGIAFFPRSNYFFYWQDQDTILSLKNEFTDAHSYFLFNNGLCVWDRSKSHTLHIKRFDPASNDFATLYERKYRSTDEVDLYWNESYVLLKVDTTIYKFDGKKETIFGYGESVDVVPGNDSLILTQKTRNGNRYLAILNQQGVEQFRLKSPNYFTARINGAWGDTIFYEEKSAITGRYIQYMVLPNMAMKRTLDSAYGDYGRFVLQNRMYKLISWRTSESFMSLYQIQNGKLAKVIEMGKGVVASGDGRLKFYGVVNGKLLFAGRKRNMGFEIYAYDLSSKSLNLLKDIRPGAGGMIRLGYDFDLNRGNGTVHVHTKDRLYFRAYNDEFGAELWTTDGTKDGTRLMRDFYPGPVGSQPREIVLADDYFVFAHYDSKNYIYSKMGLLDVVVDATTDRVCAQTEVAFYDTSFVLKGNYLKTTWKFDNSTLKVGRRVEYVFNSGGMHSIRQTVYTDIDSFTHTYNVNVPNPIVPIIYGEDTINLKDSFAYWTNHKLKKYQWQVENGDIDSSQLDLVKVIWNQSKGKIILSGIDSNGCPTRESEKRVDFHSGLEGDGDRMLNVYPNPVSKGGALTLYRTSSHDQSFTYSLTSISGGVVIRGLSFGQTASIPIAGLDAGFYLLRIDDSKSKPLEVVITN